MKEEWRALMVSALKPVDLVFISNLRPFEPSIIETIQPNVVVTTIDEPSRKKKEAFASYFRSKHPDIKLVMRSRSSFPRKTSTKMIIEKIKRI